MEESEFDQKLRRLVIYLASQYGRYGYRRVTVLIRNRGVLVNHKKVQRMWREEGLKVPKKQPKKKRLWLNDGSCIRKKPEYKNHVWSYDFVEDQTSDGRKFRMLTIIDEHSRECLAIKVKRRLTGKDVVETLADLFMLKGLPDCIRRHNGPEFTSKFVRN